MKCFEGRRNLSEAFGYGGPKVVPCGNTATKAVRIGSGAKVINGWRPTCWICAESYPGYTVVDIEEADLTPPTNDA